MAAGRAAEMGERLRAFASRAVATVALEVHHELVVSTPVDTGHARSNWVESVGEPRLEVVGSRESVDSSAQIVGEAEVAAYDVMRGDIYETNNVPYIPALNAGHSPQAAAGFIEDAIRRGVQNGEAKVAAGAAEAGVNVSFTVKGP